MNTFSFLRNTGEYVIIIYVEFLNLYFVVIEKAKICYGFFLTLYNLKTRLFGVKNAICYVSYIEENNSKSH